jgi:hypothetical protein
MSEKISCPESESLMRSIMFKSIATRLVKSQKITSVFLNHAFIAGILV